MTNDTKNALRLAYYLLAILEDAATAALDRKDMRRHEYYAKRYHDTAARIRRMEGLPC
jgi:hypothetical protein